MKKHIVDLCIIGAGSAGLSIAAGAVQMGASVVLIEHDKMGGDCLNTGCVPSKALLAASKLADHMRHANRLGLPSHDPKIDFKAINKHVHDVINTIASNDSEARFKKLGCTVIRAKGQFTDRRTVIAGSHEIKARRFVIATGSRAATPPIPGLSEVPYFTNETIFDNTENPKHLLIIGAGPIGAEMAQAHCRLGIKVSVVDIGPLLPRDEPDCAEVIRQQLKDDGIALHETIQIEKVYKTGQEICIDIIENKRKKTLKGSHLLVAAGRRPNVDDLNLEKAKVDFKPQGVITNDRLQSVSNRKVTAAGDAAGSYQFTHAASYHAGIIIRNVLFALPAKVKYTALPWVTYTDPELSHVGLMEADAKKRHPNCRILNFPFTDNDRAIAEKATRGKIKVIVTQKGHILGVTIVGRNAGELILPWCLAIENHLKISRMASLIAPYPTLSEINKRVAGSFYTEKLFSNKTRKLVRFIAKILP
jgi:pyruvate/2-oxoglutarate dehydrogenase complex dihydrolipoamide dehydrogenase (E3) component